MIVINKEICIGCGLCAADCPADRLHVENGKAVYTEGCIQCGHCVAVCPENAVSIPEYDMADVEEYRLGEYELDAGTFLRAVKFRRSIRRYKDRPVDREKMERILQAGRYTATAKNRQACRFIVVDSRLDEFRELLWNEMPKIGERLKESQPYYSMMFKLMERRKRKDPADDALFFNAPLLLCIACENPLDGGLAAANIENMAVAEGLGALYNGYLMRIIEGDPVLKKWLGIEEIPIACCMLAGYPDVTYKRTAPRKEADITWM